MTQRSADKIQDLFSLSLCCRCPLKTTKPLFSASSVKMLVRREACAPAAPATQEAADISVRRLQEPGVQPENRLRWILQNRYEIGRHGEHVRSDETDEGNQGAPDQIVNSGEFGFHGFVSFP